ncbi:glycerophosphoryl diester phosphodiesterase membrane domain-containing protein [Leifsonia kafniensis]|uniref:Glycerophosphoryl diester phosphodiesterase membrane domain-containing protein n=1 Tax=Leifsonia kafniensis TaxID=475957 RepID=A0ABP7KK82_9MICO
MSASQPGDVERDSPSPRRRVDLIDSTRFIGVLRLTRASFWHYLAIILVLQGAIVTCVVPAITSLFELALGSAGLSNLTDRNLVTMLTNPLAVLLLLLIAIIALAAVSLQISTIFIVANRQQGGRSLGLRAIVAALTWQVRRIFHYQSPVLLAYFFLIAPLGGLGLLSVLTRGIAIPPFVTGEFMKSPLSAVGYTAVIGTIFCLNLRLMLTLPLMVVSGRTPLRSLGRSMLATRGHIWKLAVSVSGPVIVAVLVSSLGVEIIVRVTELAANLNPDAAVVVESVAIGAGRVFGFIVIGITQVVVAHILISVSRELVGLTTVHPAPAAGRPRGARAITAAAWSIAAIMAMGIGMTAAPAVATPVTGASDTLVLGHRGFVGGGVENTIPALEAAAAAGVDYVETDMQQTTDGQFIASHDSNLFIVAGINRNIFDMTFEEVTSTRVRAGGHSALIPSMEEYVTRAAELGVPLLIELKVHGHETPDFVDRFLAELDSLGVTESNIYHSLSADAVEQLTAKRPELTVGYTIALTLGDLPDVNCDFFVVEQASFSPEFLSEAHAMGKPVYVWTVNDEETIRDLLRVPVDGIVTDHPDTAIRYRSLIADSRGLSFQVSDALSDLSVFR